MPFKVKASIVLIATLQLLLSPVALTQSESTAKLSVTDAVIAKSIDNLTPQDTGSQFPADIQRLFCFTRVHGAKEPTYVNHTWYHQGSEVASVQLAVRSESYRTYSSKAIEVHRKGEWKVAVRDPSGNLLKELNFSIE